MANSKQNAQSKSFGGKSFQDQSFWDLGQRFYSDAIVALNALPKWERYVHIFWLIGSFSLLIERSPADAWLSLLAVIFLGRSVVKRDFAWLKVFWVRAVLVFWGVALLSAAVSTQPAHSLVETGLWIRFPIFACATVFWLAQDRRLLYAMLMMSALGMLMMCAILLAEIMIVGAQAHRLFWPYGTAVPGNYLAKTGLPVFSVMMALVLSLRPRLASAPAVFGLLTIVMTFLTGERINFLIKAGGGMLAALMWKPRLSRCLALIAVQLMAVAAILNSKSGIATRYIDHFISQLPTGHHSHYYNTMMPGFLAFEQAPLLGIGPNNFRLLCHDLVASTHFATRPFLDCHNHPHNFYIQMLGETGLLGLIAGTVMVGAIIFACFMARQNNKDNVVAAVAFVTPLAFFWPIASSGNFFGQWNNIFMWFGLAMALAATTLKKTR